jgi:hypothetical protein
MDHNYYNPDIKDAQFYYPDYYPHLDSFYHPNSSQTVKNDPSFRVPESNYPDYAQDIESQTFTNLGSGIEIENSSRFDLEEDIMSAWGTRNDIDLLLSRFNDLSNDEKIKALEGISMMHELRSKKMWDSFEKCIEKGVFV